MNKLPGIYALYCTHLDSDSTREMRRYENVTEEVMRRKANSFNQVCCNHGGAWEETVYHYKRISL